MVLQIQPPGIEYGGWPPSDRLQTCERTVNVERQPHIPSAPSHSINSTVESQQLPQRQPIKKILGLRRLDCARKGPCDNFQVLLLQAKKDTIS